MKQFGDKLRDLREARNLKQVDVAKEIHINNKILSAYERNVCEPTIENLKILCDYYHVSADYMLSINPPEPTTATASIRPLSEDQARLLAYYDRLSTEHKDAVRGLMVLYYKEQTRHS